MTRQLSDLATALIPTIALVILVTLATLGGLVGRGPPPDVGAAGHGRAP